VLGITVVLLLLLELVARPPKVGGDGEADAEAMTPPAAAKLS
jgi:hypothetical protein